ncbi:hypothetical protein HAX54_046105 [Datura stramonium]|uniref:Uncharacterized protein n=1 Tax=Datura stramonium TaxID=4076 RepID=A0ABS8WK57_DATST|nr:hypothetical protein [Datura stramonium]
MVNVPMAEAAPPSTEGELPSAVSKTTPGSSQEKCSPTSTPRSSKTAPEEVGQETGITNVETSNPNLEGVETMDDTSRVKDVEDDDDDDVPLSTKWERLNSEVGVF